MNPVKTVVVTGGAGLIGSSLIRLLLKKNVRVISIDDVSIGEKYETEDNLICENFNIVESSIVKKLDSYNKIYNIDTIIHCAAHPGGRSLAEPVLNVETNIQGSIRIFDWCARKEKHIVFLSSSVIYGNQPSGSIAESAILKPGTIYGACKVACENFLKILGKGYGLKWTVLRVFATYGAGHRPNLYQGIVNVMLTQLLEGNRVVVKGSLERVRDLLYVEDTANAILSSFLNKKSHGQIINVGSGNGVTIKALIESLCKCLEKDFLQIEIIEEQGTVGDPLSNVSDISRAKEILGFRPQYDLLTGLSELIKMRKNYDWK